MTHYIKILCLIKGDAMSCARDLQLISEPELQGSRVKIISCSIIKDIRHVITEFCNA